MMANHYHLAHEQRSDRCIALIKWREREVRYWFSGNGCLVGIWRTKAGATRAVGHDQRGRVILYRGCPPADNWQGHSASIAK